MPWSAKKMRADVDEGRRGRDKRGAAVRGSLVRLRELYVVLKRHCTAAVAASVCGARRENAGDGVRDLASRRLAGCAGRARCARGDVAVSCALLLDPLELPAPLAGSPRPSPASLPPVHFPPRARAGRADEPRRLSTVKAGPVRRVRLRNRRRRGGVLSALRLRSCTPAHRLLARSGHRLQTQASYRDAEAARTRSHSSRRRRPLLTLSPPTDANDGQAEHHLRHG